ncbi:tetratricopeptide repeat protein [Tangfeifania diversioriginum]|uniref:tetratricopeptide repeat protein n=1 Tax=Tangfeifania diversioriginum TaxID=1168035 RepID=UPI0015870846|nr:tetratricopeptide repeat protein [Tangfeifania diversioriginum]
MNFIHRCLLKSLLSLCFIHISATLSARSPVEVDSLTSLINNAKQMIPQNLEAADSLSEIVLERSLVNQNDSLTGRAYYLLGVINYYKGNHLLSSGYYNKGLETELAATDEEFASALWNNLGVNLEYENEYEKAVEAYLKSLQLAEKLEDSLSIHQSYINIGLLYIWLTHYNQAETYLDKALDYFKRLEDDNHVGLCYHNLAILYDRSGNSEKAVETYDKSIDFYRKSGNQMELASASHDKINLLLEKKAFEAAKQGLEEAVRIADKLSNPYTSGNFNVLRGKYLFYAEKEYEKAEEYFHEAITQLESSNAQKQQINAYYMLANLYAATGNRDKHRQVLDKHNELLQQNFNEKSSEKIAEMRTLHEVEQKNMQMLALQRQSAQQKMIIILAVVLLLLALGAIVVIYFFNRKIHREHRALYKRNMELTKIIEQEQQVAQQNQFYEGNEMKKASHMFFEELFEQIKKYIIQNKRYLDSGLKVADIASEVGTNEKYVSQAISIGSKIHFNEFIAFYRINEAKKLLSSDHIQTLSISDVALRAGFSNQSTFQRKFKEMTGMTPYTFKRIASEKVVYSIEEN